MIRVQTNHKSTFTTINLTNVIHRKEKVKMARKLKGPIDYHHICLMQIVRKCVTMMAKSLILILAGKRESIFARSVQLMRLLLMVDSYLMHLWVRLKIRLVKISRLNAYCTHWTNTNKRSQIMNKTRRSMKYKRYKQIVSLGNLLGAVLKRLSWPSRDKKNLQEMRRIPLFRCTR